MLRRLLLLLIIAGTAFVIWRVRRILKARALPGVPTAWRLQAATAPRLAEAIEVRDRLARAVAKDDRPFQRTLLLDVHTILAEVAELERLRHEVEGHLAELTPGIGQDKQRQETRATLQTRAERYAREADQVVADLEQVYLELLETREAGRGGGEAAAKQTRALIETLRQQTSAQKEISRFLEKE